MGVRNAPKYASKLKAFSVDTFLPKNIGQSLDYYFYLIYKYMKFKIWVKSKIDFPNSINLKSALKGAI